MIRTPTTRTWMFAEPPQPRRRPPAADTILILTPIWIFQGDQSKPKDLHSHNHNSGSRPSWIPIPIWRWSVAGNPLTRRRVWMLAAPVPHDFLTLRPKQECNRVSRRLYLRLLFPLPGGNMTRTRILTWISGGGQQMPAADTIRTRMTRI